MWVKFGVLEVQQLVNPVRSWLASCMQGNGKTPQRVHYPTILWTQCDWRNIIGSHHHINGITIL